MAELDKATCHVRFEPDGVGIDVERGTTLLEAARRGDVYVNSICGGDGICGKCRVIVKDGKVDSPPTTLLSREEVRQDYVLACTAKVLTDAEVLIPEETRLEGGRIVLDEDAHRFGVLAAPGRPAVMFRHDPLVRKLYLELSPPSMEDPMPDHERLYQGIQAQMTVGDMQTGFSVLTSLPDVLNEAGYKVTATVARRKGTAEVVQVEPGDTSDRNLGLAIDVGTTTIVAHLLDMTTSRMIDAEATYNSQMKYGEDYISRIMYTRREDALDEMQGLIVNDVNRVVTMRTADMHDGPLKSER